MNLKTGDNLLLVKVSERGGHWSMFGGIDADVNAVYKNPVPQSRFDVALSQGLNMISIPLRPQRPYTAKSLGGMLGVPPLLSDMIQQIRTTSFTLGQIPVTVSPLRAGKGILSISRHRKQ